MLIGAFNTFSAFAQAPAFPGALGFAAGATGGRAGSVYRVTTLADSGPGSFRTGVSTGNRIIVFDVGGYINLSSTVLVQDNITIAGQTAPGDGIGVMGREVSFNGARNVIVRHFRFRQGDFDPDEQKSGINLLTATNVILDHVSIEFAQWNNIDAVNCDNITIQNSIIADPIGQQFGAHTEHLDSNFAWFYNVFANGHNRQPLAKINTIYVNNVVYNYQAAYTVADTSGHFSHDIINNYFITGPATTSAGNDFYQMNANQSIYSSGNLRDSNEDGVLNGSSTTPGGGGTVLTAPWSPLTTNATTFPTASAFRYDLSAAGTFPRDPVDALVISQVRTLGNGPTGTGAGTAGPGGGLYSSQTQSGLPNSGYGTINGGATAIDSDQDGMPDYWEVSTGSNPNSNDSMTVLGDGYARIEHFLNWLAEPHKTTGTNAPVDVNLWPYTAGFTNASPVYTVNNASNGAVTLLGDGHTARFTPAMNFSGLGSFRFSVAGADGTRYTNVVSVLVSSLEPPSSLLWVGDGLVNLWANGSGTNWLDGTNLVAFSSGDNVTFDDTGSNSPAISLSGSLSAGTVFVVASQDYIFGGSGALAGPTTLIKTGSGKLTLNTLNTFSGGTLISDGVLQLGDGASVNGSLSGNVTNNDTLIFANPTALTASMNLSGSGTLTKNGAGALTLNGTQTFTNLTTINAGTLQFSGSIPPSDVTNNGVVIFAPGSFTIYKNTISGSGRLVNNGSSTVYLLAANSFSGGVSNSAGNLVLSNNAAAGTGPVTYNGGAVLVAGGVVITNDFSVPGSATVDLMMQGTNGTGIWAGNVVNMGSGAQWRPGADTGGALMFTGNALLGSRNFIVPRGSVQFASNAVVSATGTATAFGRDTTGGNRSANVTIRDSAVITLGVCNLGGNQAGGNVTLTIQNNAVLNCGANNFDLQNVNRATAVTTLRLNGGSITVGGFTKTKTSQTNLISFNGGVLKSGADNAAFLPAFTGASNVVQAGGALIDVGGFSVTIAAPLIHDPPLGGTVDGGLTKLGAGTLTLSGSGTFTGPTTLLAGQLSLTASGSVGNSSGIHIVPGATFNVSAIGGMTLGTGRRLSGGGTVVGNFTIGSGATLAPGSNSVDTLTFNNALVLAAGSTNVFEISHSPLTNDAAKVLGSVTSGGTLIVSNISTTAFGAGDTFKLFDAAGYGGAFAKVILPSLAQGLAWNTNALASNGIISVSANPPVISSVILSGGNFVFAGSGGVTNGTFYVLTSTNVALPRGQWTLLSTNQFDANGNFAVTNAVDPAAPQTFYLLQL